MSDFVAILTSILTLAAVIVSAVSAYVAKKALQAQVVVSKNAALVAQTQRNETQLFQMPELLRLYNIDLDDLKKSDLKSEELLFVLSDLRQGEVYHRMEGYSEPMISDYRRNFLCNKKVQLAFLKYIYGQLMSKTPYTEEIKKFIETNPSS